MGVDESIHEFVLVVCHLHLHGADTHITYTHTVPLTLSDPPQFTEYSQPRYVINPVVNNVGHKLITAALYGNVVPCRVWYMVVHNIT